MKNDDQIETKLIHAGCDPEPRTGAVMPPVFLTSTYIQPAPAEHTGYEYSRTGNPTRTCLETAIAAIEGGKFGSAFSSGMGATDALIRLLDAGDHVVCGNDLYGGTHRLFTQVYRRFGLSFDFVDTTSIDPIREAWRPETKMLWLESPSNPLLHITDLAAAAKVAHEHGALVVVDNTFASPYLQQPFELGADVVVHSTTKYLGGHSDVVGGATVTNDEAIAKKIAFLQNAAGAIPGPLDCFLVHRGIKTLAVRMERHCDNAESVAAFLAEHPKVERVIYPGLATHPGREVAARQMRRFGGMVSFEVKGDVEAAKRLAMATTVFGLAESLGGVESLIQLPAAMTHAAIPREERIAAGLQDGLVRLSVGLESADDLRADLGRALEAV